MNQYRKIGKSKATIAEAQALAEPARIGAKWALITAGIALLLSIVALVRTF